MNLINKLHKNLITIEPQETIKQLLSLMDDGNIHRVFVVTNDSNNNPVATHVITQWDLLRFLLQQMGLEC